MNATIKAHYLPYTKYRLMFAQDYDKEHILGKGLIKIIWNKEECLNKRVANTIGESSTGILLIQ